MHEQFIQYIYNVPYVHMYVTPLHILQSAFSTGLDEVLCLHSHIMRKKNATLKQIKLYWLFQSLHMGSKMALD